MSFEILEDFIPIRFQEENVFIGNSFILNIQLQEHPVTNPFIIGNKIYLRAPEPGDEELYSLSQNHPEPRENLFYALPTSVDTHR